MGVNLLNWEVQGHTSQERNKSAKNLIIPKIAEEKVVLLSQQAAENMGLVEYHLDSTQVLKPSVAAEDQGAIPGLVDEYRNAFQGVCKLKRVEVKLHVDPDAKGVVQKQQGISIPLNTNSTSY